jgi:hypothetical protein
MSRSLSARALTIAVTVFATAAPVFGGSYQGALVRSGAAVASGARASPAPIARPNVVTRPMPPLQRAPGIVTRPMPPFQRAPGIVTRRMPPFQRAPGIGRHGHHHGPVVVFVQPPFFQTRPFGYAFSPYFPYYPYYSSSASYPYSSLYPYSPSYPYSWLSSFGTLRAYEATPSTNAAPYYCWVDGIGFTDEGRFVHHLHEVHGVPLDEALAATEMVGERRVFFGY